MTEGTSSFKVLANRDNQIDKTKVSPIYYMYLNKERMGHKEAGLDFTFVV